MNPLGLDTLQRLVPVYETDLNRNLPRRAQAPLPQRIAPAVLEVTSPARPLFHAPSPASGGLHLSSGRRYELAFFRLRRPSRSRVAVISDMRPTIRANDPVQIKNASIAAPFLATNTWQ
jgi:hypothetical protein